MDPYRIIRRPLLTEKGNFQTDIHNVYTFEVDRRANKLEIGKAVEQLFDVEVEKVRTMIRKGKLRRHRTNMYITPSVKRALVTLKDGNKLELI